ncbi:Glucose-1-phosphate thymidylyltransferase [subsurface metagenome]
MRCVILTGGSGTRLMPLTKDMGKAYLPLGGKRVVDHIIDRLPKGMQWSTSENDIGAPAAIAEALPKDNSPVMVICGDNYFSESLDSFISTYAGYTLIGVYDVKSRKKAQSFGVIELHRNERQISQIKEKPMHPATTLVSTGLYIFPPEVFGYIRDLAMAKPRGNLGELIQHILAFSPVYGYLFKGAWFDIGTIESYKEALKVVGK